MAQVTDGKGTLCLAAFDGTSGIKKHEIGRPAPGDDDVAFDISFCGMCHSDVHCCDGYWGFKDYPVSPGHELVGIVTEVGKNVKKFKKGDRVGVGCMVESCNDCKLCKEGLENLCPKMVQTYSTKFPEGKGMDGCVGNVTMGGYSQRITVNEKFCFNIPDSLPLEYAAPLLCAGITTFSPLNRHVKGKKDQRVGVVGFGGLGHVAVKIAKAMGAKVTVFSRSDKKREAAEKLGADLIVSSDTEAMAKTARQFDVILDTVSAQHDVNGYVNALDCNGTLVLIGGVVEPTPIGAFGLIFGNKKVEGSLIGGVPETQEMLDFCGKHDIRPDIEIIPASKADEAFKVLQSGSYVAGRYVIDISTMKDL